jgi:hypothetical protein
VRRRLKLPTSGHKGGGAMQLEGKVNLLYRSRACLFVSSKYLLNMDVLINVEKTATCLAILQNKIVHM